MSVRVTWTLAGPDRTEHLILMGSVGLTIRAKGVYQIAHPVGKVATLARSMRAPLVPSYPTTRLHGNLRRHGCCDRRARKVCMMTLQNERFSLANRSVDDGLVLLAEVDLRRLTA